MEHVNFEHLDSESIIVEVQKYPCIFDCNDEGYKNRKLKKESWSLIIKAVVGEQWVKLDGKQKEKIGEEVQKKWKSLKDAFWKSIKNIEQRNGDHGKPRKPYVFHRQMAFLLKISSPKETAVPENIRNIDSIGIDIETLPAVTNVTKTSCFPIKRKADVLEQPVEESYKVLKDLSNNPTSKSPDPDEMLLLSQVPFIKNMSLANKLDFQIEFMKLVKYFSDRVQ